ncbi:hypothetical protein ALP25_200043 [Pseudomonas syringae pv. syringae]|nr:hypothetical protein ALP25_200043 [Pseudomonas syringae pv. syringae]
MRCAAIQKNSGQAAWAVALAVAGENQFPAGEHLAFETMATITVEVIEVAEKAAVLHLA